MAPCKSASVTGRKQESGFAIAYQFAMTSYVRSNEHASLGHRLQWLKRRNDLSQPHAMTRISEHVDEFVILPNLGVWYTARENKPVGKPKSCYLSF